MERGWMVQKGLCGTSWHAVPVPGHPIRGGSAADAEPEDLSGRGMELPATTENGGNKSDTLTIALLP